MSSENKVLIQKQIFNAREKLAFFLRSVTKDKGLNVKLTQKSECSDYARCFYVFAANTIQRLDLVDIDGVAERVFEVAVSHYENEQTNTSGKPFLQLLCFSLSVLNILDKEYLKRLLSVVSDLQVDDLDTHLCRMGVHEGVAGSGNLAMFQAVLLASGNSSKETSYALDKWFSFHAAHLNERGFWSKAIRPYLEFQNGYHQYEIYQWAGYDLGDDLIRSKSILACMDNKGHFAPYPGGGGCYDYDATFMLCFSKLNFNIKEVALNRLLTTLLNEQNNDGGFGESVYNNFNFNGLFRRISHVLSAREVGVFFERAKYFIFLLNPKHKTIKTHWTIYQRDWDESDLWDSWFRMLTIQKSSIFLGYTDADEWGCQTFPGVGYTN
ncbi:hypothetical protein [Aliamphritea ceti]|uniref:hypothetical protein n=1 Tax=Aliamphritea ceti TaxID=1524258 RepID=UPI0021C2CE98|nr:hypothetical protein [Aliamphritea ceti]